eukprot:7195806-Alexandrium_andersonii.AAC.1
MNVLKIAMKHLMVKHGAWRTGQSQHMKRSAILLYVSSFPHAKCPLSQRGIRPGGHEVISKDVSARSAKRSVQ